MTTVDRDELRRRAALARDSEDEPTVEVSLPRSCAELAALLDPATVLKLLDDASGKTAIRGVLRGWNAGAYDAESGMRMLCHLLDEEPLR